MLASTGPRKHDVLVADEHGQVLAKRVIDHDEQGICELIELLLDRHVELVAIERPEGLLVGQLWRPAPSCIVGIAAAA